MVKWNKQFHYPKTSRHYYRWQTSLHLEGRETTECNYYTCQLLNLQRNKRHWAKPGEIKLAMKLPDKITKDAAHRGTTMHNILEHYFEDKFIIDLTETWSTGHEDG